MLWLPLLGRQSHQNDDSELVNNLTLLMDWNWPITMELCHLSLIVNEMWHDQPISLKKSDLTHSTNNNSCHSRLPWVGFCHFCGHVTTRAILLYSPCAFKCQIYLLLNTEFTELISFILNREAIQFENHSHRLYVNKERVDCEFSLCASDCATVLYFCGPWPYGLWTFGDICE